MREYTLSSGPLSSFDYLFDARKHDRIRDYPAVTVAPKAMPDARLADTRREPRIETAFLTTFLAGLPGKQKKIAGFTDAGSGKAGALAKALQKSPVRSSTMKYGVSEDEIVLVELADLEVDVEFLWPHYPPAYGFVFFFVANTIFDVVEIFWSRKAPDRKRTSQLLKRDALEFASQAQLVLLVDEEGAFHFIAQPGCLDLEEKIKEAGRTAGLQITDAPSLFG